MTKIVEEITAKQIKDTPKFSSGDTVVVSVKVKEGKSCPTLMYGVEIGPIKGQQGERRRRLLWSRRRNC